MNKLDDAEKKTLIIWAIVGIIFAITALIIEINFKVEKKPTNANTKEERYFLVKDYSRYYTVKGALTKFYSFSNANKLSSMLNILDKEYQKKFNIDEKNIKEVLGIKNNNIDIETEKMMEKKLKDGMYIYIVKCKEVFMTSSKEIRDVYYQVVLDGNNYHFNVKPIEESVYLEALYE